MKQQYISPIVEADVLNLGSYLQAESMTDVSGDLGYQGPGSGGGRSKERDDYDEMELQDETIWGNLW